MTDIVYRKEDFQELLDDAHCLAVYLSTGGACKLDTETLSRLLNVQADTMEQLLAYFPVVEGIGGASRDG